MTCFIRKGDYLYVDKTELVWKIASTPFWLKTRSNQCPRPITAFLIDRY